LDGLRRGERLTLMNREQASDARRRNGEAIGNLFIFDEPTTGLHFDDVAMLLQLFQRLVDRGHSIVVIEHNLEVIKCADWIIDLGPEAGEAGGEVVATGTPEQIAKIEKSHTGKFLRSVLGSAGASPAVRGAPPRTRAAHYIHGDSEFALRAAEEPFGAAPNGAVEAPALPGTNGAIQIHGAREHNLKNIDIKIPREQLVVITGLSGSGKSTLAFDILFAEGQRRFLDSMSPYARQFVEQLEKPDVDLVSGLPPSVAIEQRVTRGGGKSTVATVTEVYHFFRLLFAKTGTQFCPDCDLPVAKRRVDRETNRGGCKTRAAKGSRAARESAQRLSYRCGALGGTPGVRHTLCGWPIGPNLAFSETGALQRTHHRRGRGHDRSAASRARTRRRPACVGNRAWHGASARFEKSAHRNEHRDELSRLRPLV